MKIFPPDYNAVALRAAFEGMIKGMFTGRKLADYISAERHDFVNARRIINGTDRASLVAGYAEAFLFALRKARAPVISSRLDKPHPVVTE